MNKASLWWIGGMVMMTILLYACKSTSALPHQYENEQLIFGEGGGFAGLMTTYVLLDDRRLFKQLNDTVYQDMGKIDKELCKNLFEQSSKSGIDSLEFNYPGNLYYFVGTKADSTERMITWGNPMSTPSQEIIDLRGSLMEQVSNYFENNPVPATPGAIE